MIGATERQSAERQIWRARTVADDQVEVERESRMISHIGTVALYVADQEVALRFWIDRVGFELKADRPMTDTVRWLEVGPPGGDSSLVLYPKALMEDWQERKPSVVFVTDNVRRTCDRLTTNGVTISQPAVEMAWGDFAAFLDTEGNEFGLRA